MSERHLIEYVFVLKKSLCLMDFYIFSIDQVLIYAIFVWIMIKKRLKFALPIKIRHEIVYFVDI